LNKNIKLCISSTGEDLNSNVDPRFGRCDYFLIINPKTMNFESVLNKNSKAMGGAGIQAAELIAKKGANIVITGNVGPNAFQTLKAADIKIITGISGNIKKIVDKFNKGELKEIEGPSVDSHFGMNYRGGENL
jgi:predicted Fe-Mo cluster-binding NifX family protein